MRKKNLIIFLFLGCFAFFLVGCKHVNNGEKLVLKTEAEVKKEKEKTKYSLIISDPVRVKSLNLDENLTDLKYDDEVSLQIIEDEKKILSSLKVNGEEKKHEIVDGIIKLVIKQHTAIVSIFSDRLYTVNCQGASSKYIDFTTSYRLKYGDRCSFKLKNINPLSRYKLFIDDKPKGFLDEYKYEFEVTSDCLLNIKEVKNTNKLSIFYDFSNFDFASSVEPSFKVNNKALTLTYPKLAPFFNDIIIKPLIFRPAHYNAILTEIDEVVNTEVLLKIDIPNFYNAQETVDNYDIYVYEESIYFKEKAQPEHKYKVYLTLSYLDKENDEQYKELKINQDQFAFTITEEMKNVKLTFKAQRLY